MIILDTDHFSTLQWPGLQRDQLLARIAAAPQEKTVTIITVQESVQGWMAAINKATTAGRQVPHYAALGRLIRFFTGWTVLPFDDAAAARYESLRQQNPRLGAQDLKIAAIALTHDALLLSANLKDFRPIPGLRVEDWLTPL